MPGKYLFDPGAQFRLFLFWQTEICTQIEKGALLDPPTDSLRGNQAESGIGIPRSTTADFCLSTTWPDFSHTIQQKLCSISRPRDASIFSIAASRRLLVVTRTIIATGTVIMRESSDQPQPNSFIVVFHVAFHLLYIVSCHKLRSPRVRGSRSPTLRSPTS